MITMLEQLPKQGIKLPLQLFRRHKAKSAISRLTLHSNPQLKAVGIAIQESLTHSLSLQERQVISLIEERRSALLRLKKKIAVVDYGAGSSRSKRTRSEMDEGVSSTAFVSKITMASKPKFWATILFKLIRHLESQSCVELGSCVGISGSYQASALKLNGKGSLITLEGSDEVAHLAKETFSHLGIYNASVVTGPFHRTLNDVFEASKPIDFFFNDGHHDHDAVMHYFNQVMPYLSDAAIIVFDDISWSSGMRKVWAEIENDERVSASINLHSMGIVLIDSRLNNKEKFKIPL